MEETERIEQFYQELKKQDDMRFVAGSAIYYFMAFIGVMLQFMPISIMKETNYYFIGISFFPFCMALYMKMAPYITIYQGNIRGSVCYFLKFCPVDKKALNQVIKQHLNHDIKGLFIGSFLCQQAGALIFTHRITVLNLIYPILLVGMVYTIMLLIIKR